MSTSGLKSGKERAGRTASVYLEAAVFCGLFSSIYESFSHGVYSNFMVFLFLFPLLGGALPFGVMWLLDGRGTPGRLAANLYHSGIATLALGSCMAGVLEIYGTTSEYLWIYWAVGGAFTAAGVLAALLSLGRTHRAEP